MAKSHKILANEKDERIISYSLFIHKISICVIQRIKNKYIGMFQYLYVYIFSKFICYVSSIYLTSAVFTWQEILKLYVIAFEAI